MVTKIWDSIATWYFYNNKRDNYHFFWKYDSREASCDPIWNFWATRKVLELLYISKILIPNKVNLYGVDNLIIETNGLSVEEILDKLIEKTNKKNLLGMTFTGITILFNNGKEDLFENLVKFSCSLDTGQFNLQVYSDCWVPIDLNDNLQIDLAEKNSPRLSKVLKDIKDIGFDTVDPGEGVDYQDELLPQHGFKIFLRDGALNYVDDKLTEEDVKIIEKYLWKNRRLNGS